MNSRGLILLAGLLAFMFSSIEPAAAADASNCTVQARGESVTILVCPPDLKPEDWRKAGEDACGEMITCNVWIWEDSNKAPTQAPKTDSDLTQEQIHAAVAVWVNDSKRMMLLRRVGQ